MDYALSQFVCFKLKCLTHYKLDSTFFSLRKQISVAGTDLLERREADEHPGVPETEGAGRNASRGRSEDVDHQSGF